MGLILQDIPQKYNGKNRISPGFQKIL